MKNTIKKGIIPFTQISNELLNCTILSLKAKGLYSYMYSKPEKWTFTIKSMSTQLKEGNDAIMTALQELKLLGWINYDKKADGSGVYNLEYEPKPENPTLAIEPKPDNPNQDKPKQGKPKCISNKDLDCNKDSLNKEKQLKQTNKGELLFFENLFKEKFNSEIVYSGKYNRNYNLESINKLLKIKKTGLREFFAVCLETTDRVLRKQLTPAGIYHNYDAFAVITSTGQQVAALPFKTYTRQYVENYLKENINSTKYTTALHNGKHYFVDAVTFDNKKLTPGDYKLAI